MKKLICLTLTLTAFLYAANSSSVEAITKSEENCFHLYDNYCDNTLTNGLQPNQTTLFYMYTDNSGHWFIDPLNDANNLIYVGLDDLKHLGLFNYDVCSLTPGKRFVGTFSDMFLWELVELTEVEIVDYMDLKQ